MKEPMTFIPIQCKQFTVKDWLLRSNFCIVQFLFWTPKKWLTTCKLSKQVWKKKEKSLWDGSKGMMSPWRKFMLTAFHLLYAASKTLIAQETKQNAFSQCWFFTVSLNNFLLLHHKYWTQILYKIGFLILLFMYSEVPGWYTCFHR